jgi:hypothetical protein
MMVSDKKLEECTGCIGITEEHTCEGYQDFLALKADMDPQARLKKQAAEIERLRGVEEAARGILRAATGTREEKAAFKALKQALKENEGE